MKSHRALGKGHWSATHSRQVVPAVMQQLQARQQCRQARVEGNRQFKLHPPGHVAASPCRSGSVLLDDKRQTEDLGCTYEALSLEQ